MAYRLKILLQLRSIQYTLVLSWIPILPLWQTLWTMHSLSYDLPLVRLAHDF